MEETAGQPAEILQASSLEDCAWPEVDPHDVGQASRPMTPAHVELVRTCLDSARINLDKVLKDLRKQGHRDDEIVLSLIAHRKFQMNPPSRVSAEPQWQRCVTAAMKEQRPIDIVYPQFCCIANAPKRYSNVGPAAGEDCTIEFFKLINSHIQTVYPPGVRFHVLADAALYASAFQTHHTEVYTYQEGVAERIKELDASSIVFLYDYAELLRTRCPEYQKLYYSIAPKVWAGNPASQLPPGTRVDTLRRSVRCSVNTRRFQLTHDDHRKLFGPLEWRAENHPFFKIIEELTEVAFREVITVRLACNAVDISNQLWPDAIRATCHKGQKNGRWAMGLRSYPEYYGSCKLLPYHGMPVIKRDSKGKPKLEIEPEVLLRGQMDLVRVTSPKPGLGSWPTGEDEVYAYVASDIDEELGIS